MLALLLYELSLFTVAICGTATIVGRRQTNPTSAVDIITITLAIKLYIGCLLAMLITSSGLNAYATYLAVAAVLLAGAGRWISWKSSLFHDTRQAILLALIDRRTLLHWAVLLPFVPLLLNNVGPVQEIDSLHSLNSVFSWANNNTTPLDSTWYYPPFWGLSYDLCRSELCDGALHYPAFWELSYVPSFVLTKTDYFWWWTSLQAVLLVAFSGLALAKFLKLRTTLAVMAAANGVAIYHYWFGPSGVMTLKTDMPMAAGVMIFAYGVIQIIAGQRNLYSRILISIGASFILLKYSGVPLLLIAVFLFVLFYGIRNSSYRREIFILLGMGLLFVLASSGQYYIENFMIFDNPFYLSRINIGLFSLPGYTEPAGSSILSKLGSKRALDRVAWDIVLATSSRHIVPTDLGFLPSHRTGYWGASTFGLAACRIGCILSFLHSQHG